MFIPDPDLDFLPIPDPGVKKAPDPGSGSATLVLNVFKYEIMFWQQLFFKLWMFSLFLSFKYGHDTLWSHMTVPVGTGIGLLQDGSVVWIPWRKARWKGCKRHLFFRREFDKSSYQCLFPISDRLYILTEDPDYAALRDLKLTWKLTLESLVVRRMEI